MIGSYCRAYRTVKNVTLLELGGDEKMVKTLSAFEHGRSTNMNHLVIYIKLSHTLNDHDSFMRGLVGVIIDGID